jgi:hypothetical protein
MSSRVGTVIEAMYHPPASLARDREEEGGRVIEIECG